VLIMGSARAGTDTGPPGSSNNAITLHVGEDGLADADAGCKMLSQMASSTTSLERDIYKGGATVTAELGVRAEVLR
jgi:hypothetical protein